MCARSGEERELAFIHANIYIAKVLEGRAGWPVLDRAT